MTAMSWVAMTFMSGYDSRVMVGAFTPIGGYWKPARRGPLHPQNSEMVQDLQTANSKSPSWHGRGLKFPRRKAALMAAGLWRGLERPVRAVSQ